MDLVIYGMILIVIIRVNFLGNNSCSGFRNESNGIL